MRRSAKLALTEFSRCLPKTPSVPRQTLGEDDQNGGLASGDYP